ncbi:MAG TPA: MgtC/SapB family protein, partial [Actinomycetospora sp.]|uniref:MgtC/SapB family protein n=1 Tax=Actinomycetospora sp. TaxID=1872135 RepID=UPI002F3F1F45
MDTVTALAHAGTALAIGLMIGLERERSGRETRPKLTAGARTFALIALVGAVAAALGTAALVVA